MPAHDPYTHEERPSFTLHYVDERILLDLDRPIDEALDALACELAAERAAEGRP